MGQMYTRISHRGLACPIFSPTPEVAVDFPAARCVHKFVIRGVVPGHIPLRNRDTRARGKKKTARDGPVRQRPGPPPPPSQPLITQCANVLLKRERAIKLEKVTKPCGALMHDHASSSPTTCVVFRCVLVMHRRQVLTVPRNCCRVNPVARPLGESPGCSPAPARMPCADNAAFKGSSEDLGTAPISRRINGKGGGGCGVGV